MSTISSQHREFALFLTQVKEQAMRIGLYRTARLLEIPVQEIGWEIQGMDTPPEQKKRQQESLTP